MKKNNSFRTLFITLLALICSMSMHAQNNSLDQELYQDLHGHGSMNAVLTVIVIILGGLFLTIWRVDRKVARMEREFKEKK